MIDLKPYLEMTKMMILATQDPKRNPYTSNVYFGYNPETYNFYFISRLTREHSQHIISNGNIAWSILNTQKYIGSDQDKKGLQFQGQARLLEGDAAKTVFDTYYQPRIAFPGGLPDGHHVFECRPTKVKIWDESLYGGQGNIIEF
ncbi:pyridoxamine 5'-phosphate oxidase family protein [Candidatus Gracilibacteria bacterium]|nr:pyridoxamine 5'-phosphate oxidase family protein [Candidatus Gracilibacteria bacterium]